MDQVGMALLFLGLLAGSFLASGAEVAYFSLSKVEIDSFKESETPGGQRVWNLLNNAKRLLATILITNNFVNVAAILVASNLLQQYAAAFELSKEVQLLLEIVLITSLLLLFGEIVPKVYAARNRLRLVNLLSVPLLLLRGFFSPLSWVLIRGTQFIDRRLQFHEETHSLEDLRQAIDLTTPKNEEEMEEQNLLKGIFNFSNITVRSIMRARVDVKSIELSTPFDELIEYVRTHGYSRLPVYTENLDQIVGILHIKDLLPYLRQGAPEVDLQSVLRDAYYVPEIKKIDDLLEEFKTEHIHMAIVVDEYGGTAGIVTLEDVIEEIFGEINDEFDREDWIYTKVSEYQYKFSGRTSLHDVRKILDLDDNEFEDARGDSDSLAGLILELHGKIPSIGEIIEHQQFKFVVETVSKNRIVKVGLEILPKEEASETDE